MTIKEILTFWFEEIAPEKRFFGGEEVDNLVRARFLTTYEDAIEGKFNHWKETPDGCLALILVLDQFSRNMFRGSPRSFEFDPMARQIAEDAIAKDFDLELEVERRGFYYLPFMHSENYEDQSKCIELVATRLGESGKKTLVHAKAHAVVIKEFGRFPFRNTALGRENTAKESSWLEAGGYIEAVKLIESQEENS